MKSITKLQVKDFVRWLRKQARKFGSDASVGYIGDHRDYPLECYLQELTGKRVSGTSCDGYSIGSKLHYLSTALEGFSICVFEGSVDELPECGWSEISAQEMLYKVMEHFGNDLNDYIFSQPEEMALAA